MHQKNFMKIVILTVIVTLVSVMSSWAKGGKLEVVAHPHTAYVFLDGVPMGDTSRSFMDNLSITGISPGEHTVSLYNYGFKPEERKVNIIEGKWVKLEVTLTPLTGTVSGPFGRLQLEGGKGRGGVLLNGKTPDFFVGHVDEFNHNIWWKQQLLVPPGTHQITVLQAGTGQEVYSGTATVEANKRTIVSLKEKGQTKTTDWPGALTTAPRFSSGIASATVAVGKPTAQLSAGSAQVNCGDSTQLKWTTTDAPAVEIGGVGKVASSGEQSVQPTQTTSYKLTATGPGGSVDSSATVTVNNAIQADLSVSPAQVQYRRVADKVVEQGSATLNWSASNASSVSVDPLGSVNASGSRAIEAKPLKNDMGKVDETLTYTLHATNACGGSETRTASLHIVGAIEQPTETSELTQLAAKLALHSIYFPTAQPTVRDPERGLLPSQQNVLSTLAEDFKKYMGYKPEAKLILAAHADKRGSKEYNQALSERRVKRTMSFLVEHGVPETSLETRALGKEDNLSADQVKELVEQNPSLTAEQRQKLLKQFPVLVLANNRRVDVTLSTTHEESLRYYPFNAEDFLTLIDTKRTESAKRPPKAGTKKKSK